MRQTVLTTDRKVARAFVPLIGPSRFKAAHGGRGGAKSHFFGDSVHDALLAGKRIVCIREIQNTIQESCKQLIEDKIAARGLGHHFEIQDKIIKSDTGGRCIFKGMRDFNADNIKSLEGFDIAWVEEAQTMSARSLDLLIPTIRKEKSELWFSWNPRHATDPVDVMFRQNTPDNAVVIEVGWADNPWLPDVLRDEKDRAYATDLEKAEHVWGGGYEIISEGALYARQIIGARKDGRITRLPYDTSGLVFTGWDLGRDDETAIWFGQIIGREPRIIDYYKNSIETLPHYAEIIRNKPYAYGGHFLPHDGNNKTILAEHSAKEQLETLGLANISVISRAINTEAVMGDIETARRLIGLCAFDENKCKDGLHALQSYRREYDPRLETFKQKPLHDWSSHGADAFRTLAVAWNADMMIAPAKPAPLVLPDLGVY